MIYFDHSATSFPKPQTVVEAVSEALSVYAANPGRGGHKLAAMAADKVFKTRVKLAQLFGLQDPKRVIFFPNATVALNQAIKGLPLEKGDHVITTNYEHNSVRRPLEFLKAEKGIEITYLQVPPNGEFIEHDWIAAIKSTTKMIVVTHGSNLTGLIMPLEKIANVANQHGIPFVVDASQTAGVLPISMDKMGIDMVAFPGHKGLLGPQGIGALLVRQGIELNPIHHGGTGSFSELIEQPSRWPDRFESGTLNTPGIAGLLAGIEHVEAVGLEHIYEHEASLATRLINGLKGIPGVNILGPEIGTKRLGVVSFQMEGIDSQEIGMILDAHYDIAVRAGLHCTPLAHESVGTADGGAIRASFGMTNTIDEVDRFISAIEEIMIGYHG